MTQIDTVNKDVLLAAALASGKTASAAARQMELSLSTVQRRMAQPEFRQLVSDLRGEMLAAALGRMTDHMTRAADTFAALLDSDNPALRLRAARALVTLGLRLHDAVDIASRMREVEAELAKRQGVVPYRHAPSLRAPDSLQCTVPPKL
jgi:hypothetical protein